VSALLEVADLGVALPIGKEQREVVRSVSLQIDAGEALGLVGESGSGKSMTARALLRLLPEGASTRGSITFDGRSLPALSDAELSALRAREIAIIHQDPRAHMNPVRRIGDFLCEALVYCRGMARREAEQRVIALLAETGIDNARERMSQYPHELSGGLLQRVMIVAALAIEPRLLIADEPTTALDVTTQAEVMATLDQLRRERGLALLFISHDLDLAAAVCDRTAVMYAGAIMEVQSSSTLHERPLHPYAAALASARPSVERRIARLPSLRGRPLAAFEVHRGCPFSPRCPNAEDQCRELAPPLRPYGGGEVACVRAEELRGHMRELSDAGELGAA
jgi:oligopeptide/dipeptide ABC transporter ATP-binding protein